jgi:hypothetical protein
MTQKKLAPALLMTLLVTLGHLAAAFDWPEETVTAASFLAPFGHLRGDALTGSLVFAQSATTHASDAGVVIAVISDPPDGSSRFSSPLGNLIVIDHSDDLITVYANMAEIALDTDPINLETGTTLGRSGFSGWTAGPEAGLEFQVIDTLHGRMINPRILMPRLENEAVYRVAGLSADNGRDPPYRILEGAALPVGMYSLYHDYDPLRIPYSTTVSVNGADIETLAFNMLIARDGRLTVRGNHYYPSAQIYVPGLVVPGPAAPRRVLLGTIPLLRGRNTIRIMSTNINGLEDTTAAYTVENY